MVVVVAIDDGNNGRFVRNAIVQSERAGSRLVRKTLRRFTFQVKPNERPVLSVESARRSHYVRIAFFL